MTCIYCQSNGPFTAEHVIPAGLGGDDNDWILKDIVCGDCNTKIFSKLEVKFMRSSPLAIARLFLQPTTRVRGSRAEKPTIHAPINYFDDPETGILLEQEFSGSQPVILPQVVVQPPNIFSVFAANIDSARTFLDKLGEIGTKVSIIKKVQDGIEVRFIQTVLSLEGNQYLVGETESHATAPKEGIWLEPLKRPANNTHSLLPPRIFRRSKGGLVCRADSIEQTAKIITYLRNNHSALVISDTTPTSRINRPKIQFKQIFDIEAYDRVLTKIGFNLCAHLLGENVVRSASFDSARLYARYGIGQIKKCPPDVALKNAQNYPRLAHHHLMIVTISPPRDGELGYLMVLMRFFDGPIEAIVIAEGTDGIPQRQEEIFIVNDYYNNKIYKLNLEEFCSFSLKNQPKNS